jgi:hypothetical protein
MARLWYEHAGHAGSGRGREKWDFLIFHSFGAVNPHARSGRFSLTKPGTTEWKIWMSPFSRRPDLPGYG